MPKNPLPKEPQASSKSPLSDAARFVNLARAVVKMTEAPKFAVELKNARQRIRHVLTYFL